MNQIELNILPSIRVDNTQQKSQKKKKERKKNLRSELQQDAHEEK
jgi:predicted amidophosphoribosyltransferase